jgi:phage terminase small subunit
MDPDLTAKQLRFCEEYLIDLNATQAAIRAGYSKHSARFIGQENLTKPNIRTKILWLMEERSKKTGITVERVLEHLAACGFSLITDLISWDAQGNVTILPSADLKGPAGVARFSQKDGSISVKMHDKIRALIALGNHLDMFGKIRGRGEDLPDAPAAHGDDKDWPLRLITKVPDGDWTM